MSHYTTAQRNGEPWAKPHAPYVGVKPQYGANLYLDNDTGRSRWAVLHHSSGTWYFPKHYGMRSAVAMAHRMNGKA